MNELSDAVLNNDALRVALLLRSGHSPHVKFVKIMETALGYACANDSSIAFMLIDSGADVNQPNILGTSPLMRAAARNQGELVQYLIAHGAEVNVLDNLGLTPLMYSVGANSYIVAKILIPHIKDLNIQSKQGSTALMQAADKGCIEICKMLIDGGANVDMSNPQHNNMTALDYAKCHGHMEICNILSRASQRHKVGVRLA